MTKREEICVKVYTFKLPKSVSSIMKVCIRLFKKDEEKK
ncbi:stage V sporulation protein SpoVM [Psychrobacillus sp. AK 1817]